MTYTFKCGHSQEQEPRFMGRGQARQTRLAEYFNRNCPKCAEQNVLATLASYTDMHGNPRPATQEVIDARLTKLRASY